MDEDDDNYEQYAHYADDIPDHEEHEHVHEYEHEHDEKQEALVHADGEQGEGEGEGEQQAIVPYDHGIVPDIQNIVATVNLGTPLDLKQIAMRARNAEYNPKKFSACTMRIRSPKTTALVFSSGKIVVTGARQVDQAKLAARKYARIIQRIGFTDVRFLDFTIRNMVASADVRFPIKLEELAQAADETCSYEPEIFPGLVYHITQPKVVVLVFVSGKVVITGAKSLQDVIDGFDAIFPILQDYQKSNPIT